MLSLLWHRRNQPSPRRGRPRRVHLEVELLESRNLLSPVQFVPMSPIASGLNGSDLTTTVGDVNGDGHLDVISTSSETVIQGNQMVTKHTVVWYENNGAAVPSFTPHTIAVADSPIPWVGVGDIDGNGALDAVMEIGGQIYWYANNGDGTVWTPHLVPGAQGDLSVWIADVEGDGHNDLILPYGNTITWWDNLKGDGTEWTPHVITDQVSLPLPAPPSSPAPPSLPGSNSAGDAPSQGNSFVYAGQGQVVSSGTATLVPGQTWAAPPSGLIQNSDPLFLGVPTFPAGNDFSPKLDSSGVDITGARIGQPYLNVNALAPSSGLAVSVVWGGINILSVGDINGDGKLDIFS
jgi:hypothetical protein